MLGGKAEEEARGVRLGSGEEGSEEGSEDGRGWRVGRKDGEEDVGDDDEEEGFRGVETLADGGGICSVTTSKMCGFPILKSGSKKTSGTWESWGRSFSSLFLRGPGSPSMKLEGRACLRERASSKRCHSGEIALT